MVDILDDKTKIQLPNTQAATSGLDFSDTSLFSDFLNSDLATDFANDVSRALSVKSNNTYRFASKIAGRLFENLAYLYLAQKYNNGRYLLLSPDETFEIYTSLYPLRIMRGPDGFEKGIQGISVPDGLLLQNSNKTIQIKEILEYKAISAELDNEANQARFFSNSRLIRDNLMIQSWTQRHNVGDILKAIRPELENKPVKLHPDYKFSYAVPRNSTLYLHSSKRIEIPIFPLQLRNVTNALILDCQPS